MLGHPMGDVSYYPVYANHAEFDTFIDELPDRGIPTETEWRERYCELTGRGEIEHWTFYIAWGLDGIASSKFELGQQRQSVSDRARKAWKLVERVR